MLLLKMNLITKSRSLYLGYGWPRVPASPTGHAEAAFAVKHHAKLTTEQFHNPS